MNFEIAEGSGFCFGVRRAIRLALHAAAAGERKIATIGPLVHNPIVVEMLEEKGIRPVKEITDEIDVAIISAHGIPESQLKILGERRAEIIDATCPLVKRSQRYAKALKDEGYQVILLGDRKHPEVMSVSSYAGDNHIVVVESVDELPESLGPRVGILTQTTQPEKTFLELVQRVVPSAKVVKVVNTICPSSAARLTKTKTLARSVQVMIVIGGRNSHNTLELVRVSRLTGTDTHHIERVDELQVQWFRNIGKVGISAGASTPNRQIEDVAKRISAFGNSAF